MHQYTQPRREAVLDIETYKNYFLVKFYDLTSKRFASIEMREDRAQLDVARIRKFLRTYRVVTFNGNSYDMLMVAMALEGASNQELKDLSDRIILTQLKPWDVEREFGISVPGYVDHIDLIEVAPGDGSLKLYSGRLHSQKMQDLPIEPDAWLDDDDMDAISEYCGNDCCCTADLYDALRAQVSLRERMSERYGVDLRSKSDAQIAEAVIIREIEKRTGRKVYKPDAFESLFHYKPPAYIKFESPILQERLDLVRRTKFAVNNGKVDLPKAIAAPFEFKGAKYKMGIGGLHSMESTVAHIADSDFLLLDADVTSYYPMLILLTRLFPKHIGEIFLTVYREIVFERMRAKRDMKRASSESAAAVIRVIVETLKIVANGTFGKLGSRWSKLFSPNQMIQVTLTGQLAILMLIERLHKAGMAVVSANTDGVVSRVPCHKLLDYYDVCFNWETDTGLPLEFAAYSAVYSRDVNNYLAIYTSGKVKRKGVLERSSLKKAPQNEVCNDAVVAYLTDGTDVRETIEGCADVRKFLTVRRVNGGAMLGDEYVGKAIRWYYAAGHKGGLTYRTTGNSVPRTDGAMPLMELPDELPDDIDYNWYVREAYGILDDIGARAPREKDPAFRGRNGYTLARRPDAKNVHTIDLRTGVALCGARLLGRHDRWVEYPATPTGHRDCAKCKREGL